MPEQLKNSKEIFIKEVKECPFTPYPKKEYLVNRINKINNQQDIEILYKEFKEWIDIVSKIELQNEQDLIDAERKIKKL